MKKLFLGFCLASLITPAFAQQCPSVDEIKAMVKNPPAMTAEEYEAILNTYSCCEIDPKTPGELILKTCPAHEALNLLKKDKVKIPSMGSLFPKLMKHQSPQVRARAYTTFQSIFGSSEKDLKMAREAIANEKDLYALNVLLKYGISNAGNKDPEIGKFLLNMAKHEDSGIRNNAARALANPWSDKVEGAVDAVISLMSDSNEKVVKTACSGAGKLSDEKVIEPIVAILNDASKEKFHADCIQGLTTLWYDYPFHKRTSEKAYKATLDYWKKTPRTQKVPAWNSISTLSHKAEKEFPNWLKKATYYKADEVIAVMTEIIKDGDANWLGRAAAFKVVATLGGKAEFDKLAPIVEGLTDSKASQMKSSYQNEAKRVK